MKRQATAGGGVTGSVLVNGGSLTSSSGGCGSMTSLNSGTAVGRNESQQIHVSTFSSPRLQHNKIPDYFFKDEKEQRKLLAASRGGKQLISLKVVESLSPNNSTNA